MVNDSEREIPVWTLATEEVSLPAGIDDGPMTPERLKELRSALAAWAETPIATLEVHPLPAGLDRSRGIALSNASALATNLSALIGQSPKQGAGEALYRMVVPAKFAAQLGGGLVSPMLSKAVPNGIHSALTNSSGIAAQAAFVKVAGTGAATAGAAAAGTATATIVGPLIVAALAAGLSIGSQIVQEMTRITELLEELKEIELEKERIKLDSCRSAIEKTTAILLDHGHIGQAIGLSPAVSKVDEAIAAASRRLKVWKQSLDGFPDGPVELAKIKKKFPGIERPGGKFRAHIELAELAIALKRRVLVLQAVEQAQMDSANPYPRFLRALTADQRDVDQLESGIAGVLRRLSKLRPDASHGLLDFVYTESEVEELLRVSHELRELGEGIDTSRRPADVAIEIVRSGDGSVVVLPAYTLQS